MHRGSCQMCYVLTLRLDLSTAVWLSSERPWLRSFNKHLWKDGPVQHHGWLGFQRLGLILVYGNFFFSDQRSGSFSIFCMSLLTLTMGDSLTSLFSNVSLQHQWLTLINMSIIIFVVGNTKLWLAFLAVIMFSFKIFFIAFNILGRNYFKVL